MAKKNAAEDAEPTAEPDLLFSYHPKVEGDHLGGVPARDLSLEDYEALEDFPRAELLANSKSGAAIYHQEHKISEARSVRKDRRDQAKETAKTALDEHYKTMQPDPDTRTPGRTDSDTISPGQAVPQGDEPVSEGAPGFVPADTGGSTLPG